MNSTAKKIAAFLILLLFVPSTSAFPFGEAIPLNSSDSFTPPVKIQSIQIPTELGEIRDRVVLSEKNPLVILIEDAHANYEAQKNIKKLIDHLGSNYGIRNVFLEGAASKLRPELFRFFSDPKLNQNIADIMMRDGKFSGAESFLLNSHHSEIQAYGIESPKIYRENLEVFRNLLKSKKDIQLYLERLHNKVQRRINIVCSKELRDFTRLLQNFHNHHVSLSVYACKLAEYAQMAHLFDENSKDAQLKYPNVVRLLKLSKLEGKIDFKKANQEKNMLTQSLSSKLPNGDLSSFRDIDKAQFPRFLLEKIHEETRGSIDFKRYPYFLLYLRHLLFRSEISPDSLMNELEILHGEVLTQLIKNPNEQSAIQLAEDCMLLNKLLTLDLNRQEFKKIISQKERYLPSALSGQFGLGMEQDHSFYDALRFYTLAIDREESFIAKVSTVLASSRQSSGVLVAGGFHSSGIKEVFEKKGVSLLVVRPRLGPVSNTKEIYHQAILGDSALSEKSNLSNVLELIPLKEQKKMGARVHERVRDIFEAIKTAAEEQRNGRLTISDVSELGQSPFVRENEISLSFDMKQHLSIRFEGRPVVSFPFESYQKKAASLGAPQEAAAFLIEQGINFDPRFNSRAQKLMQIPVAEWSSDQWAEYYRLVEDARKASDWMSGWIKNSPHCSAIKGHPPVLLSMEGIISAVEEGKGPRLSSYHGGLGVLFGEWIRAIAYLGGVTTLDPTSEAPEFTIFIPDYQQGVHVSEVHAFGFPNLGKHSVMRPQDYGIDLFRLPNHVDPMLIKIPMFQNSKLNGEIDFRNVFVGFRLVKVGAIQIIMPTTDIHLNHPSDRNIFEQLYKGPTSSKERFEQEWVLGLAAYEFRRHLKIKNGPIHMNETATFPYLIGAIKGYMEEGYSYEDALELVGGQIIFFTHTLVQAGIDRFQDSYVPLGHFIRCYFEQSDHPSVREQAGNVAKWMIHGRKSDDDRILLPGFEQTYSQGVYSPLHFIVKLAHLFDGTVVAVSQLNAIKADNFFVEQGILTRADITRKPVQGITNGVDHLFWMIPEIVSKMRWSEARTEDRRPEAILDPQDPMVKELYQILHPDDPKLPELLREGGEPQIPDDELVAILQKYKVKAVQMVRDTVRKQYLREIGKIEQRQDRREAQPSELERLHALRVRWARWIGVDNPEAWVSNWESKPLQEQEPYRRMLVESELVKLLDPNLFLGVWARRIVNYKRILFAVFGKYLPVVERKLDPDRGLSPSEMDILIQEWYSKGVFKRFLQLVIDQRVQLVFAGKTFSEDGRSSVALLHRIIECLSVNHPEIQDRVIFLEGYDETESQPLVRGADVWINTPKRPLEASGTSGMKNSHPNLFASPMGDGWGASGIMDGLNGRVRGIPHINQDHPDEWGSSGGSKDTRQETDKRQSSENYYFQQEARNFFMMMGEEARRYYSGSRDWLRAIRRWIYFTALVYDIRGEFTGRLVPSFSADIRGGPERGIVELYAQAIEKEKTARLRIEQARQGASSGANSLGIEIRDNQNNWLMSPGFDFSDPKDREILNKSLNEALQNDVQVDDDRLKLIIARVKEIADVRGNSKVAHAINLIKFKMLAKASNSKESRNYALTFKEGAPFDTVIGDDNKIKFSGRRVYLGIVRDTLIMREGLIDLLPVNTLAQIIYRLLEKETESIPKELSLRDYQLFYLLEEELEYVLGGRDELKGAVNELKQIQVEILKNTLIQLDPNRPIFAIVGAGIAGVAAIDSIRRDAKRKRLPDPQFIVFDANPLIGGKILYAIPYFRPHIKIPYLTGRAGIGTLLNDKNVYLVPNFELGKNISLDEFKNLPFDGIVFAGGQPEPTMNIKDIEGGEGSGVYGSDKIYRPFNTVELSLPEKEGSNFPHPMHWVRGKRVVVQGGGNVSLDVARIALQEGAKSVTLLYRRGYEVFASSLNTDLAERNGTEAAGLDYKMMAGIKKIIRDSTGKIIGVQLQKYDYDNTELRGVRDINSFLAGKDKNERKAWIQKLKSNETKLILQKDELGQTITEGIDADLVIFATGDKLYPGISRKKVADGKSPELALVDVTFTTTDGIVHWIAAGDAATGGSKAGKSRISAGAAASRINPEGIRSVDERTELIKQVTKLSEASSLGRNRLLALFASRNDKKSLDELLQYSLNSDRAAPEHIFEIAVSIAEGTFFFPNAQQILAIYLSLLEQFKGKSNIDPAIQEFNEDQNFEIISTYLGLTEHEAISLPIFIQESIFGSKDSEVKQAAGRIDSEMERSDLLVASLTSNNIPPVISELHKVSKGKYKVRTLQEPLLTQARISELIKPFSVTAVALIDMNHRGELEIQFKHGDRIKIDVHLLMERGVNMPQLIALIRKISSNPLLRKMRYTKAGFSSDGTDFTVDKEFIRVIKSIYLKAQKSVMLRHSA